MPKRTQVPGGPDRNAALAQYRQRASVYDLELTLFEPLRAESIAALALRPGDTVLDVGCGTGLSLPGLMRAVGADGRVVGIEQSPEMFELARQRVADHGWTQVSLHCAPVEDAEIDLRADAALFHFTHDILRQVDAIANVLQGLKPGARVVASGLKWAAPGLGWGMNLFELPAALRSVTSLQGMGRPWSLLQEQLGPMRVQQRMLGGAYLASGTR